MKQTRKGRISCLLFFIFCGSLGFFPFSAAAGTFYGETKTGLIELEDYKYPVFLYVPDDIKEGKRYPLMISIPGEGEEAEDHIKKWMSLLQVRTVIILVPTYLRPEDIPAAYDKWLFQIKNLVSFEYPVNRNAVYLVGNEGAVPYAAYLGVNFPEEFTAVALIEGSLAGTFDKLMKLESRPSRQLPFYVAIKESSGDLIESTKTRAFEFEESGYPLEVKTYPEGEEFYRREFNRDIFDWLTNKGEDWRVLAQQDKLSFKEKVRKGIDRFFTL